MTWARVPFRSLPGGGALSLLAITASGCAPDPDDALARSPCAGRAEQPMIEATQEETYLGLAPSQARAIVELIDGTGETDALCTGVAVAPTWILSAAHCGAISGLAARVQSAAGTAAELVPVARMVRGPPGLDLALFELDFQSFPAATSVLDWGVSPIPTAPPDSRLAVGDAVELAGAGVTETGSTAGLRFLVETIVGIDETWLLVDGYGMSGACDGDSGGPLLARSSAGSLFVGGILSTGATSCRDQDRYLRLDGVRDWVEASAGIQPALEQECGSIDVEGRCLYGGAVWCEDGLLRGEDCALSGAACGWEAARAGFRCVDARSDPCRDIDAVGRCRASDAVTCNAGTLVKEACGVCGACRVDGRTGAPYCANGPED